MLMLKLLTNGLRRCSNEKPTISRVRITKNGMRLSGPIANDFMNILRKEIEEKEQLKKGIKEAKENDSEIKRLESWL